MADRTILLAAGGTGGHLFPAEALAHELLGPRLDGAPGDRQPGRALCRQFPGAARPSDLRRRRSASKNPLALARSFWTILRGVRQASAADRRMKPAAVVGFGGYPTLPPLYAATRRGVPTLIHEQNAVMGRANKALAARVSAIAGGFLADGDGALSAARPCSPAIRCGQRSWPQRQTPFDAPEADGPFRLLVFGGSQGAPVLLRRRAAGDRAACPSDSARAAAHHPAGAPGRRSAVREAYASLGVEAEVSPFFSDMAGAHRRKRIW